VKGTTATPAKEPKETNERGKRKRVEEKEFE
jgi:hypothetical protein